MILLGIFISPPTCLDGLLGKPLQSNSNVAPKGCAAFNGHSQKVVINLSNDTKFEEIQALLSLCFGATNWQHNTFPWFSLRSQEWLPGLAAPGYPAPGVVWLHHTFTLAATAAHALPY